MSALEYIYLAAGTCIAGAVMTFALILVCSYLSVDVIKNLWLLAIPTVLSLLLNIIAIEFYRRHKKK